VPRQIRHKNPQPLQRKPLRNERHDLFIRRQPMKKNDVTLRVILAGIDDICHQPTPSCIDDYRRLSKQRRSRQQKSNNAQRNRGNRPNPPPLLRGFLSQIVLSPFRVPRQIYLRDKLEFR
jgi:hypothetical protein